MIMIRIYQNHNLQTCGTGRKNHTIISKKSSQLSFFLIKLIAKLDTTSIPQWEYQSKTNKQQQTSALEWTAKGKTLRVLWVAFLTLYLIENPFNAFANRAGPDQAVSVGTVWSDSTVYAYGNMIYQIVH